MPSGIILSSGSQGATKEAIEKVLADNGFEADTPEVQETELVEPKREDFKTDEEFEAAQTEFENKQDEAEDEKEEQARIEQERRHKPSRRERAVEKATKPLKDEIAKLTKKVEELSSGKKGEPAAAAEVKVEAAPKRESFKTDEEYQDALFDHRYKLRRQKEAMEEARNSEEARLKDNFTTYQSAVAELKETEEFEDWDEVVGKSTPISEAVYFSILELREAGARVTYYLATHPEELDRLNKLSHHAAAMEVARLLDSKLKTGAPKPGEAGSKRQTKPRPRLPEPVRPTSTAASASTLTSREAAKSGNFRAFRAAQRAGR